MGGPAPAYPAASLRAWAPLALTLGLHLLLVLAWLGAARGKLANKPSPHASFFVLAQPSPLLRSGREPAPAAAPPPLRRVRPPAPVAIDLARPAAAALPAPAVSAPTSSTEGNMEGQTEAQAEPAPAPLPGELLASSKAMARQVDRELRRGAPPIMAEPERKWERFAEAFAAARKGAANTATLDSYTAPDGVVIYRKTVGGRVSCYRSGSVGGLVTGFGAADGHSAGKTTCPSGVGWTRH